MYIIYTICSLFIHVLMDTEVAFHILAIVNNAALSIGVQVSFELSFCFLGIYPSGIAGSCVCSSLLVLRNLHRALLFFNHLLC